MPNEEYIEGFDLNDLPPPPRPLNCPVEVLALMDNRMPFFGTVKDGFRVYTISTKATSETSCHVEITWRKIA